MAQTALAAYSDALAAACTAYNAALNANRTAAYADAPNRTAYDAAHAAYADAFYAARTAYNAAIDAARTAFIDALYAVNQADSRGDDEGRA